MDRKNDKLWLGAVIGLVVPFVGYALLLVVYEQLETVGWLTDQGFAFNFRQRTTAIIAIALNLIPLTYFRRHRAGRAVNGVIYLTMAYALAWFFLFGQALLNQ